MVSSIDATWLLRWVLISAMGAGSCYLFAQQHANTSGARILRTESDRSRFPTDVDGLRILGSRSLVIAERDGRVITWRLEDGFPDTVFIATGEDIISDMIVTHDEQKVFVFLGRFNTKKRSVSCYSIADHRLLWSSAPISFWSYRNGIGVSANDSLLYLVGPSKVTRMSAVDGRVLGKERMFLELYHTPRLGSLECEFSPSGRYVAFRPSPFGLSEPHRGHWVHVWDFQLNKHVGDAFFDGQDVLGVSFLPGETRILTGNYDGTIRAWSFDHTAPDSVWTLSTRTDSIRPDVGPIGKVLLPEKGGTIGVQTSYKGTPSLMIYTYPDFRMTSVLLDPRFARLFHYSVAFSDDGDHLVVCDKGYLCLYDTHDWQLKWRTPIAPAD